MRRIGFIDNPRDAERFCDFLLLQDISAVADESGGSAQSGSAPVAIWVRDEPQVESAREHLQRFLADPTAAQYDATAQAAAKRKADQERNLQRLRNQRKLAHSGGGVGRAASGGIPITIATIILCVIVGLLTGFGRPRYSQTPQGDVIPSSELKVYDAFKFVSIADWQQTADPFASIKRGQLWRVLTPALLHGYMGHLVMNMMGVYFLGSVIERLHGGRWLLAMLIGCAICSTLVQVFWPAWNNGGANMVGASGATYGLFGFLMLRPHFQPMYPVSLPPMFLLLGIGFLVAGVMMVIPSMANGAHVGGFATGMVFASCIPTPHR